MGAVESLTLWDQPLFRSIPDAQENDKYIEIKIGTKPGQKQSQSVFVII